MFSSSDAEKIPCYVQNEVAAFEKNSNILFGYEISLAAGIHTVHHISKIKRPNLDVEHSYLQ